MRLYGGGREIGDEKEYLSGFSSVLRTRVGLAPGWEI